MQDAGQSALPQMQHGERAENPGRAGGGAHAGGARRARRGATPPVCRCRRRHGDCDAGRGREHEPRGAPRLRGRRSRLLGRPERERFAQPRGAFRTMSSTPSLAASARLSDGSPPFFPLHTSPSSRWHRSPWPHCARKERSLHGAARARCTWATRTCYAACRARRCALSLSRRAAACCYLPTCCCLSGTLATHSPHHWKPANPYSPQRVRTTRAQASPLLGGGAPIISLDINGATLGAPADADGVLGPALPQVDLLHANLEEVTAGNGWEPVVTGRRADGRGRATPLRPLRAAACLLLALLAAGLAAHSHLRSRRHVSSP